MNNAPIKKLQIQARRLFAALLILLLLCIMPACAKPDAQLLPLAASPAVQDDSSALEIGDDIIAFITSNSWVDIYDSNFILEFDMRTASMLESNTVSGRQASYRIAVDENGISIATDGVACGIVALAADGEMLIIDYGEPVGKVEYRINK